MITADLLKEGSIFNYDNETWICTKNDGFLLEAEPVNENSKRGSMMLIGAFAYNVTLIKA